MALSVVLAILIAVLCFFFSLLVGIKLADIFEANWVAYLGPVVGLAVGIGFGLTRIPFEAGLAAGIIGAGAAAIAIFRGQP